jgi:hypothetical protein
MITRLGKIYGIGSKNYKISKYNLGGDLIKK